MIKTIMMCIGTLVMFFLLAFFCVGGIRSCWSSAKATMDTTASERKVRDSLGLENLRLENEKLRMEIERLKSGGD